MPNKRSVEGEYRVGNVGTDGTFTISRGRPRRPPSAAEAAFPFLGFCGTSELVPFPSVAGHFVRGSAWAAHGLPQRLKPRFIFVGFFGTS
jgi:hypothetical protein